MLGPCNTLQTYNWLHAESSRGGNKDILFSIHHFIRRLLSSLMLGPCNPLQTYNWLHAESLRGGNKDKLFSIHHFIRRLRSFMLGPCNPLQTYNWLHAESSRGGNKDILFSVNYFIRTLLSSLILALATPSRHTIDHMLSHQGGGTKTYSKAYTTFLGRFAPLIVSSVLYYY